MPKAEKTQLKRVKIDEIIRGTKTSVGSGDKKGRGRPKKSEFQLGQQTNPIKSDIVTGIPNSVPAPTIKNESGTNGAANPNPLQVIPQYDTTEEAKGFLRTPFELAAGLTNISTLNLLPAELEAMLPSWKVVYDKRIAPNLGSNADLITLAMVASGVLFNKYSIYKVETKRIEIAKKNSPMQVSDVKPTVETPQFVIPTQNVAPVNKPMPDPIPFSLNQ